MCVGLSLALILFLFLEIILWKIFIGRYRSLVEISDNFVTVMGTLKSIKKLNNGIAFSLEDSGYKVVFIIPGGDKVCQLTEAYKTPVHRTIIVDGEEKVVDLVTFAKVFNSNDCFSNLNSYLGKDIEVDLPFRRDTLINSVQSTLTEFSVFQNFVYSSLFKTEFSIKSKFIKFMAQ